MKDFIKIGGAITSSPLNENFRRLRNDISISNTNLIFPEEHAIEMTVGDMEALITDPEVVLENGQVCYTVSSGELYRYNSTDKVWYKIADFGQTFRQAFLTSGVVMIQEGLNHAKSYIAKKDNHTLTIPAMLVYFKTLPGDEKYLKGMYKIDKTDLDVSSCTIANSYSIYLNGSEVSLRQANNNNIFTISTGLPTSDEPNKIYIGSFLIDGNGNVIDNFIYTLPDIAFTEDRGLFYLTGGQTKGCNLIAAGEGQNLLGGIAGFYYDEGINAPQGELEDFPIDGLDMVNYNIRSVNAENGLSRSVYVYPINPISNPMTDTHGAVDYNHYYNNGSLSSVSQGQFTIQRHLITPYGYDCTDLIVYGTKLYNSIEDAMSEINQLEALELNIPFVEVCRLVVGVPTSGQSFHTDDPNYCRFITLDRLAQVGTLEPNFADDKLIIHSGNVSDPTPAKMRFNLDLLETESFNNLMELLVPTRARISYLYGNPNVTTENKYITDNVINTVNTKSNTYRDLNGGRYGFEIADISDITDVRGRLMLIEKEIWDTLKQTEGVDNPLYEQSIRYRLFHLESRTTSLEGRMTTAETNITRLDNTKVHKNTTINGYKLGDSLSNPNEIKSIILSADDINETGQSPLGLPHLWFSQDRVRNVDYVSTAYSHSQVNGTGTVSSVNPHGLSMDDISDGSSSHSITTEQQTKINNLPNNTISELATKISGVDIYSGVTKQNVSPITKLRFKTGGAVVTIPTSDTAEIECIGRVGDDVMLKNVYDPNNTGHVNLAEKAYNINGMDIAGNNKYYGTNNLGAQGIYTLPTYVSTENRSVTSLDSFLFTPENRSVWLSHLGDSRIVYPSNTEEHTLGTNVHDLVVNHYHKVYDNSTQVLSNNYKGVLLGDEGHVIFSIGNSNYYFDDANLEENNNIYYTSGDNSVTIENENQTRSAMITSVSFVHTKYTPYSLVENTTYYINDEGRYYIFTATSSQTGGANLYYNEYNNLLYTIVNNTVVQIPLVNVSSPSGVQIVWAECQTLNMNRQPNWDQINEWNFGNNLTVSVSGNRATINAAAPGASSTTTFQGLDDVNVTYSLANVDKFLALKNEGTDANPIYRIELENGLNPDDYMLKSTYVNSGGQGIVRHAILADTATLATTATTSNNSLSLQNKIVDDTDTTTSSLWTANKIISYVTNNTPDTYCGTVVPSSGNYKEGDIFVLIN